MTQELFFEQSLSGNKNWSNKNNMADERGNLETESTQGVDDPLLKAVQEGQEEDIVPLIEQGADVNKRYQKNRTLLMIAAEKEHFNIVNILISKGAEVDAQDEDGRTPLIFAAQEGHDKIVDILLEAGADVNVVAEKDGETALTLVREELVIVRLVQNVLKITNPETKYVPQ